MPKENKTKYAILGLLSLAPMSGYDIKKMTLSSISNFWQENYGHIYPVLRRMESQGLVTVDISKGKGKPDRKVYSITEQGRRQLAVWLDLAPDSEPKRNEFLLKVFFGHLIPANSIIGKIREERSRREELLERLTGIEQQMSEYEETSSENLLTLWLSTVRYGITVSHAIIGWCDETEINLARKNKG
jgi:PadR family transcriptional regulator, regulatory protein AphA